MLVCDFFFLSTIAMRVDWCVAAITVITISTFKKVLGNIGTLNGTWAHNTHLEDILPVTYAQDILIP